MLEPVDVGSTYPPIDFLLVAQWWLFTAILSQWTHHALQVDVLWRPAVSDISHNIFQIVKPLMYCKENPQSFNTASRSHENRQPKNAYMQGFARRFSFLVMTCMRPRTRWSSSQTVVTFEGCPQSR